MWTSNFWRQAAERAIKTFAQAAVALLTGDGLDVLNVNWGDVISVGMLATIASILTSIITANMGEPNDPSAIHKEPEAA